MDSNLTISDALLPREEYFAWDIFLYVIIFLQVIALVLLFSSTLKDTIMIAIVMICGFADKAYIFGFIDGRESVQYHAKNAFGTYVIRITMFALPFVLVTQTKVGRAKPICAILGVLSLIYMFARWFFQQRNTPEVINTGMAMEYGTMVAHMGWIWLVYRHPRWEALRKIEEAVAKDA